MKFAKIISANGVYSSILIENDIVLVFKVIIICFRHGLWSVRPDLFCFRHRLYDVILHFGFPDMIYAMPDLIYVVPDMVYVTSDVVLAFQTLFIWWQTLFLLFIVVRKDYKSALSGLCDGRRCYGCLF